MDKTIERNNLHKTIWNIANDLRGSVDGWDFKMYVLDFLFYRYLSEFFVSKVNKNEIESGNVDFDYRNITDEMALAIKPHTINFLGFYIAPSELFENVVLSDLENPNLNEKMTNIFKNIIASTVGTRSEKDFNGLFNDVDLSTNGKLGNTVLEVNQRLSKIMSSINELNLGDINDHNNDTFGDTYEYLMKMYAANAGKSGGEFFTPQEVSRLLMLLSLQNKKEVNKVYDPTCGAGSLLLQGAKILGKDKVENGFFGQELNKTTYNLARINMLLHGIDYDKFNIANGDTLTNPVHWDDQPFDVIVSNPPYSIPWKVDENPNLINDIRFSPAGVLAPRGKSDYAFIMHSLSWLAPNGIASIVVFPGILYRNGAEQKIRKYLIENNFIDTIIQLPDNLFFGTSIATCIMVLKKDLKQDTKIRFIDASQEFVKVTKNNFLTEENIQSIYKMYDDRNVDIQYKARLVSQDEIINNDYNLSVSTYVEKEDTREKIDIKALNKKIAETVARENELRLAIDNIIKEIEG